MYVENAEANGSAYVVFGATGGIGSEVCFRLAAGMARLLLAARDEQKLERLSAEVGGVCKVADVTRANQVEACVDAGVAEFGRVAGVANCVGSLLLKPAHRTSEEEWNDVLAANLSSAFAVVRAGARRGRRARDGAFAAGWLGAQPSGIPVPRGPMPGGVRSCCGRDTSLLIGPGPAPENRAQPVYNSALVSGRRVAGICSGRTHNAGARLTARV